MAIDYAVGMFSLVITVLLDIYGCANVVSCGTTNLFCMRTRDLNCNLQGRSLFCGRSCNFYCFLNRMCQHDFVELKRLRSSSHQSRSCPLFSTVIHLRREEDFKSNGPPEVVFFCRVKRIPFPARSLVVCNCTHKVEEKVAFGIMA